MYSNARWRVSLQQQVPSQVVSHAPCHTDGIFTFFTNQTEYHTHSSAALNLKWCRMHDTAMLPSYQVQLALAQQLLQQRPKAVATGAAGLAAAA
jgi:hypothetical protein